jgi:hypothetical protein
MAIDHPPEPVAVSGRLVQDDQAEKLTHWASGTIPWDAEDPS